MVKTPYLVRPQQLLGLQGFNRIFQHILVHLQTKQVIEESADQHRILAEEEGRICSELSPAGSEFGITAKEEGIDIEVDLSQWGYQRSC